MAFHRIDSPSGVVYFRSDKILLRHGFASRLGGVSRCIHTSSLNQAKGRGDPDDVVDENRRRFLMALGIAPDSLAHLSQIHSDHVLYAPPSLPRELAGGLKLEGDGLYTDAAGVALGVKTADCVPILLWAPDIKAVAAIHAGWRGTVADIVTVGCSKLCSLGAKPERIVAAIGPAICYDCYPVGEDILNTAAANLGPTLAREFIHEGSDARLHADLPGLNRRLLLEFGLMDDNIDVCTMCTCHMPGLYFSHRFSHGWRGTMMSVISL